jgi:hypothetical protein
MKRLAIERSNLLIIAATVCALTWVALSGTLAGVSAESSTVHTDPAFELGDGVDPAIPGIADLLGSEQPGPDWADLFNYDRSLKDRVDEFGAPQPNGVPDFLDTYGPIRTRRDAAFVFDEISVGQAVDSTTLTQPGFVGPSVVDPADDLGNLYAYSAFNSELDAVIYVGAERLSTADGDIIFQLGRNPASLAENGQILSQRTVGDLEIWASYSAGTLSYVEIRSWQALDAENGIYGWLTVENLPANPSQTAEQCNRLGTLCAVCNGVSVAAGEWPTFDSIGSQVGSLVPDSFLEIGVNLTALLGQHTFENYYDSRYTSLEVFTATDYASGSFLRASQSALTANSGS